MRTNKRHQTLRKLAVRVGAGLLITGVGATLALATPAAAESPSSVVGLHLGSKGYSVALVQQALQTHGYPPAGGVDGYYGAGTESQVAAFQKSQGLQQSGKVDSATAAALGLSEGSSASSKSSDAAQSSDASASTPSPSSTSQAMSIDAWKGLTTGSSGMSVVNLQARLVELGVTVQGGVDGHYGAGTTAAVAAYQSSLGMKATGAVDGDTAKALVDGQKFSGSQPAAEAAAPTTMVGLNVGSRGDMVKQLQQKLVDGGISVGGGVDGVYGALTAAAVRTFQSSSGLPSTGEVDEATADAIAKLSAAADTSISGLNRGDRGARVIRLQNLLVSAGIRVEGGVDGVYGAGTEAAVRAYQTGIGIDTTGTVTDATASHLDKGTKVDNKNTASDTMVGLKAGALGTLVTDLQSKLVKAGVTVRGGVDGIFGPATASAVKAFQTSQGLDATGVVDEATVAALANPKPVASTDSNGSGSTAGFAAYGEQSSRVTALQKALIAAGVSVGGGADGQFGAKTTAALIAFQKEHGLPVSGKVDDATAQALGLSAMEKPATPSPSSASISVFPVQAACNYVDTWGASRGGGRSHIGVDILAATGKEIYAVADGTIAKVYTNYPGSLAGNGVRLTTDDGTYYFYAHMSQLGDGIQLGVPVKAGQVIGYVGATGNAGIPHLHFEVHPGGGSAINPYPVVKAVNGC